MSTKGFSPWYCMYSWAPSLPANQGNRQVLTVTSFPSCPSSWASGGGPGDSTTGRPFEGKCREGFGTLFLAQVGESRRCPLLFKVISKAKGRTSRDESTTPRPAEDPDLDGETPNSVCGDLPTHVGSQSSFQCQVTFSSNKQDSLLKTCLPTIWAKSRRKRKSYNFVLFFGLTKVEFSLSCLGRGTV